MGLVEMGHVIIYNMLLDAFTVLRMVAGHVRWLCRRRGNRKAEASHHHNQEPEPRRHLGERLSLADTAELPPFDYVN